MKVLIAEHEKSLRKLLHSLLERWGHEVTVASNVNALWAACSGPELPQMVILDWMMPGVDFVALCQQLRGREDRPYILLVTDAGRREDIVEGLAAGADDYMTKPFDARELRVRMRVGQQVLMLQEELARSKQVLQTQMLRDPETGLWMEGAIIDILHRELNRARRENISIGLVRVRVEPQDSLSERVWKDLAERIRRSVRSYDSPGWYGQDLLVVLPGCDEERTQIVARRIRWVLSAEPLQAEEEERVRISVGGTSLRGGRVMSVEKFIQRAEKALEEEIQDKGGSNGV